MHQAPLMPDLSAPGHRVMPGIPPAFHNATSPPANAPPASGYRLPLHGTAAFPEQSVAGVPPCRDVDGSPVYFGSALLDKSVQPCKVAPRLSPPALSHSGAKRCPTTGASISFPSTQLLWSSFLLLKDTCLSAGVLLRVVTRRMAMLCSMVLRSSVVLEFLVRLELIWAAVMSPSAERSTSSQITMKCWKY
ncbi:hypothetical protein BDZ89DRAFT_67401 [Hymenopellis radicata]|nr:hypothetical protein BDZ89DRAFT_67401 [Hymenopellis radicata]